MAKINIVPTDAWQKIALGRVIVTVLERGRGSIYFNEVGSDPTAHISRPDVGEQYEQDEAKETWVRTPDDTRPWKIQVDGVLT